MVTFEYSDHQAAEPKKKVAISAVPLICEFTIIRDQRERSGGWTFTGLHATSKEKYRPIIVPLEEQHMKTADYQISGLPVFVERKSHSDFIGSCTNGHANLRKEFERMAEIIAAGGKCAMIVESSLDAVHREVTDLLSQRKASYEGIEGLLSSWPWKYGVPITFCGTRELAERMCFKMFKAEWERRSV